MSEFHRVSGRCPACNGETLFLGLGDYVTCSWVECPNPTMVAYLLDGKGHILSAAQVEKLRGITDPGPAPCSCGRCSCGNYDDAKRIGAWLEQKRIHDEIARLLDGDRS